MDFENEVKLAEFVSTVWLDKMLKILNNIGNLVPSFSLSIDQSSKIYRKYDDIKNIISELNAMVKTNNTKLIGPRVHYINEKCSSLSYKRLYNFTRIYALLIEYEVHIVEKYGNNSDTNKINYIMCSQMLDIFKDTFYDYFRYGNTHLPARIPSLIKYYNNNIIADCNSNLTFKNKYDYELIKSVLNELNDDDYDGDFTSSNTTSNYNPSKLFNDDENSMILNEY